MISSLQGKIVKKENKFVVLEVGGVGFKVFLTESALNKIPEKENNLKLHTYLYLKEERVELYGFLTEEELDLFETLKEISGIGPRTALALTSFGSLLNLKNIMEKEEERFFREVKGIGKKKMQKILLELTGKIKESSKSKDPIETDEALNALISIGFPRQKAKEALLNLPSEIQDTEAKIKEAIKVLGRKK
ncbi:MAG: Holliday junction branch migration protein RuvA [Candidatus Nealsonbacteria bacterium]